MGPDGAVNILYRRELEHGPELSAFREEKIGEYREKFANPYVAAERGYIDEIIEPRDTRARLTRGPRPPAHQAGQQPAQEAREHSAVSGSSRDRQPRFTTSWGSEIPATYEPVAGRARERARRVSVYAWHPPRHVPVAGVDHAPVRGLRLGSRDQQALPLPARPGPDRAVRGLRPAHPDGLRPRRAGGLRRGRQGRGFHRLARGHGGSVSRDPARSGLHVDDHQRHRLDSPRPLRGGGPTAGGTDRRSSPGPSRTIS